MSPPSATAGLSFNLSAALEASSCKQKSRRAQRSKMALMSKEDQKPEAQRLPDHHTIYSQDHHRPHFSSSPKMPTTSTVNPWSRLHESKVLLAGEQNAPSSGKILEPACSPPGSPALSSSSFNSDGGYSTCSTTSQDSDYSDDEEILRLTNPEMYREAEATIDVSRFETVFVTPSCQPIMFNYNARNTPDVPSSTSNKARNRHRAFLPAQIPIYRYGFIFTPNTRTLR